MVENTFQQNYKYCSNGGRHFLVPKFKKVTNGIVFEVNDKGYRGKDTAKEMFTKNRVVVFGDSCSFGCLSTMPYPFLVEDKLKQKYDIEIINGAIEGYDLKYCMERIIETQNIYEYNIAFLYIGWNNIYCYGNLGENYIKEGIFNIKMVLDKYNKKSIFFTLPTLLSPSLDLDTFNKVVTGNDIAMHLHKKVSNNEEIKYMYYICKFYRDRYIEYGKIMDVPVIDLFTFVDSLSQEERNKMFFDPVHMLQYGHEKITKFIVDEIIKMKLFD